MNLLPLVPAAFLSGVLMFLAPCTLPIVPGYLAFIAGVAPGEEKRSRGRIMRSAVAFCIGFAVVFILFGTFAAFLGSFLGEWRYTLARLGGLLFIFFGLIMLDLLHLPLIGSEWHLKMPSWLLIGSPASSTVLGALFALGWSPCIGPILGSILFIASLRGAVLQGAFLLLIFSCGLATPLLIAAALMERIGEHLRHLAALSSLLQKLGGVILIGLGVLMLTNEMGLLVTWGYGIFGGLGYDKLLNYL